MKMLLIVFRQSLEDDIHKLLKDLEITAFTQAPEVQGAGESGSAMQSSTWPGANSIIMSAMDDQQADRVTEKFKAFRDQLAARQKGAKVPIRLFALPCERLM